jgi:hypothetical protein
MLASYLDVPRMHKQPSILVPLLLMGGPCVDEADGGGEPMCRFRNPGEEHIRQLVVGSLGYPNSLDPSPVHHDHQMWHYQCP